MIDTSGHHKIRKYKNIEDFLEICFWGKILKIVMFHTIKKFKLIFKKYNVKPLMSGRKMPEFELRN